MEIPVGDILNRHMAMGVFALYVVAVSLLRIMAEPEFFRLTVLKKIWGRTIGLTIHFIANVALPLVFGIVFLSQGIASFSSPEKLTENKYVSPPSATYLLLARDAGRSDANVSVEFSPLSLDPISNPLDILPP